MEVNRKVKPASHFTGASLDVHTGLPTASKNGLPPSLVASLCHLSNATECAVRFPPTSSTTFAGPKYCEPKMASRDLGAGPAKDSCLRNIIAIGLRSHLASIPVSERHLGRKIILRSNQKHLLGPAQCIMRYYSATKVPFLIGDLVEYCHSAPEMLAY